MNSFHVPFDISCKTCSACLFYDFQYQECFKQLTLWACQAALHSTSVLHIMTPLGGKKNKKQNKTVEGNCQFCDVPTRYQPCIHKAHRKLRGKECNSVENGYQSPVSLTPTNNVLLS